MFDTKNVLCNNHSHQHCYNLSCMNILWRLHHWLEGTSLTSDLPQRVQDTIKKQQDASEILISWIQLAVILTFATLYAISPKAFSDDIMLTPVPWAIGLYLIFTVIRVVLAHLFYLPRWLLWISVALDVVLLMGLIWTFHIQYEQPPSFYLKAPTILYVFIFISIRALRFDPGFVVLSGVAAALGWLVMVSYAIINAPIEVSITRDYIQYMTSNDILIGAEFDKIISILVVTAILTIGITRARNRLVSEIAVASVASDLSRFLPSQVVDQVTRSATRMETGYCESGQATILFFDIEAFTKISEQLAPQQLVATLNDYFETVAAPISKHGGVICQFQGDAVLASFNIPQKDENHAEKAILAAIEILQEVANRRFNGVELSIRIGINTGSIVGGLVGTKNQVGYTIHGNAVNLASRLEQLNKVTDTRILISESTFNLAPTCQGHLRSLDAQEIRGQKEPVQVYTLATNIN
ncbi:MAG: adenylate cyclase [Parasphingorhabdus sp.]